MASIEFPVYKDKVSGYFYTQPTVTNNISDFNPVVFRSALIYYPRNNLSLWQGYDRIVSLTDNVQYSENRIWQQAVLDNKYKDLSINNRVRLEERLIKDAGGTSVRFRYRLRLTHPISKNKKWYAATSNEIFFNLNTLNNRPDGFLQNRLFIGIGRKLLENVNGEIGYQLEFVNIPSPQANLMRHSIVTNISIKIPNRYSSSSSNYRE